MLRLAAALSVLSSAVLLAACGGSETGRSEVPPPTSPAPAATNESAVEPDKATETTQVTVQGDHETADTTPSDDHGAAAATGQADGEATDATQQDHKTMDTTPSDDHGAAAAMDAADHMDHSRGTVEGSEGMAVRIEIEPDTVTGFNVHLDTEAFTFTPQSAGREHRAGEGHAHLYIDGRKVARMYGNWYHLGALEPGEHEIRVTLNANTHEEYALGEDLVEDSFAIEVPEPGRDGSGHADHRTVEGSEGMAVRIEIEPDTVTGFNVHLDTEAFTFTPQSAGREHRAGEGHAHLYIDGRKVARMYGNWYHLGAFELDAFESGQHEIRVTLNANTHDEYELGGKPISAVAVITTEGEAGDGADGAPADGHEVDSEHPDGQDGTAAGHEIALQGGEPLEGIARITVKKGDQVRFSVTSDTATEVHVHGFDVTKSVTPDQPATFDFEASFEGIFDVEAHMHHEDVEIAKIVIEPS